LCFAAAAAAAAAVAAAGAAAAAAGQTIRFFINETRRSLSHFRDVVDEDIWLIYNDKVVFSGRHLHEDVSGGYMSLIGCHCLCCCEMVQDT
jgi:hypothetical protein